VTFVILGLAALFGALKAWSAAFLCIVAGAIAYFFEHGLGDDRSRRRTRAFLFRARGGGLYRRNVGAALDGLDRRLRPLNLEDHRRDPFRPMAPDRESAVRVGSAPFGWTLLDATLRFAFAYPIGLLLLNWALFDAEARIGTLVILPSGAPAWTPIGMLIALGVLIVSFVLPSRARVVVQLAALGSAVAVAVAGAVAGAVAFAVAGAFAWATRRGFGVSAQLGLVILGLSSIFAALALAPEMDERLTTLLVFLLLLPLVNALFDYASIGCTRWLLRRGVDAPGRAWLYGGVDVLLALGLFVFLRIVLIIGVHWMNAFSGSELLDLQSLFADLRSGERGGDYWWLYLTIFSTLVPTLLHFSITLLSGAALCVQAARHRLMPILDAARPNSYPYSIAVLGLTVTTTMSLLIPPGLFFAFGYGVLRLAPSVGSAYLWFFEWVAQAIGATVEPGPVFIEV
jgi:hypothetical protein